MKKRGISPLIATVLLVGIAVAAAAMVFLWSQHFTKDIQEKQGAIAEQRLSCATDVTIDVLGVESGFITVENKGRGKIDAFLLRLTNQDGSATNQELQVSIEQGGVKKLPFSGNPKKIDVIPKLRISEGVFQPCSDQRITYSI